MAGLEDLFAGVKGGYEQAGGVTPANLFTGAEANPAPIPQNVAGGAGGLLGSIFGKATDLAVRTIPEIIKNPASFVNDQGELSLTRVLFPDFRRQKEQEARQAAEQQKAEMSAKLITQGQDILKNAMSLGTPEARAAAAPLLGGQDDPRVQQAIETANLEQQAATEAATASGANPALAKIANVDLAGKLGATEFSAGQTRETQRRAFGQRKQLQDERLQAQREAQTQRLAASQNAPGGIPSTGAERRDQKNVEALRQALAANAIPEASIPLAQSAVDAGSGSLALQVLTQSGYAAGRRDSSRVLQDKGFVEARNRANNAAKTLETMRSVQQVASTPDGAGIDPSLFSPAMALTLPEDADRLSVALSVMNPDFAQRKQALMSTAGKASQQYILDMTGKVSNVNELNRIRNVAPNGNEASGALFVSKMRAFNSALQREQQTAEREAQAIAEAIQNGDWKGTLPGGIAAGLQAERDASLRQLADDLSSATTNPDLHSDAPLTEAERQDLEKYGYGK